MFISQGTAVLPQGPTLATHTRHLLTTSLWSLSYSYIHETGGTQPNPASWPRNPETSTLCVASYFAVNRLEPKIAWGPRTAAQSCSRWGSIPPSSTSNVPACPRGTWGPRLGLAACWGAAGATSKMLAVPKAPGRAPCEPRHREMSCFRGCHRSMTEPRQKQMSETTIINRDSAI